MSDTYRHIKDVDADTTHVLLSADTLLRCPLESSNARILDFVEILHTLRHIDKDVRTSRVRTEAPDLTRVRDVPTELVREDTRADLVIVTRVDLAGLDGERELLIDWQRLCV